MTRQQNKDIQQTPKRAIIYCRVSTDDQENNTSLETQEADCRAYAAANGVEVVAVLWESFTGTLLWEREELKRVRDFYRRGAANVVIVRTFDRLSRVHTHFAILSEEMQRYHVELECAKEHVDKSPMGQVARIIMSALAEVELGKIIDRTITGRRNTVAIKKKIIPSWKPRYGYRYDNPEKGKRTRFLVNDEEAHVVRYIHMKYDAGISISDIVRELIALGIRPPYKAWTRMAVLRILRYRPYTGKGQFFTEHAYNARYPIDPVDIPEGLVPQIISEELFERNQGRLAINQQEAARNNEQPEDFLLRAGHIFCAECGRRMHGKRRLRGKKKQSISLTYVCTATSELETATKVCAGQRINAHGVDTLVWQFVHDLADDAETIVQRLREAIEANDFSADMTALRNSIATWEARREQYKRDLRSPYLQGPARDVILQELSATEQTIEGLKTELQKLAAHEVNKEQLNKQYEILVRWFERLQEGEEELPYTAKRDLMRFLGLKAYVMKKKEQDAERYIRVQLHLPRIASIILPSSPRLSSMVEKEPTPQKEVEESFKYWGETADELDTSRATGTDTTDGHIAQRALRTQFGAAQRRILGEISAAGVASCDRTALQ